jgi:hypothetical protein
VNTWNFARRCSTEGTTWSEGSGPALGNLEHGGEYPDTMPQAIKLIDAEGRSSIYVPIMQNGKVVVGSQGHVFDAEDE